MSPNLIWQYTAVIIIILILLIRILYKLRKNRRQGKTTGSCCGCAIADTCIKNTKTKASSSPDATVKDCHSSK